MIINLEELELGGNSSIGSKNFPVNFLFCARPILDLFVENLVFLLFTTPAYG
jgi:hypothetical protein